MMDERAVLGCFEENMDTLYPMFFGVSCAFFALRLLPETDSDDHKWLEIRNRMLKGSAHLLGLLVWRIQRLSQFVGPEMLRKLKNAHQVIDELKRRRSEEAKANEKVVSIIAAREQTWFDERKKLRQQISSLINVLRILDADRVKLMPDLHEKLKEKDRVIEEEMKKRQEIEEKAKKAEDLVVELRESAKLEAERHSGEIMKHKTAFIELVSNERQLEAEMGRALRQVEAAKQEMDEVLEQKEQSVVMVQRLSMELVKARKDLEQKDQILSAMLRKSRLDTAEKEMLLKEMRSSKVRRRQAELETAKWKAISESRDERRSLRNMLSKRVNLKSDMLSGGKGAHMSMDAGNVRDVNMEAEAYKNAIEERHKREVDAFAEQLRIKDEKVEALRWRLLSRELESKRLQSHVERLDGDLMQVRKENEKLEALLLDCGMELHSLKPNSPHEAAFNDNALWSNVKIVKRKLGQKRQETKAIPEEIPQPVQNERSEETPAKDPTKDIILTLKYPKKEIQEAKDAASGQCRVQQECTESDDIGKAETSSSVGQGSSKRSSSAWKMDVHALGVLYKIKRLKQQLVMLERLAGKQESCENEQYSNRHLGLNGFYALTALMNKQIDRYHSLQGKTDDLCQRMHDDNLNLNDKGSTIARTEGETKKLEHFLEETFQLQRYIVATGQKLMEVQAKIASGIICDSDKIEKPDNFDMERFADCIRTLFREVQRGLEVRISRIIGDLEGTLACDGFIHSKNSLCVVRT